MQPVFLQFRQHFAIARFDPAPACRSQAGPQIVQGGEQGTQFLAGGAVAQDIPDVSGRERPFCGQAAQGSPGQGIDPLGHAPGMAQGGIEAGQQYRIPQNQILPRGPFQIGRPLGDILNQTGEEQGLRADFPAAIHKTFDHHPTPHGGPAQQQGDEKKARQHALAEGDSGHERGRPAGQKCVV